MKKSTKIILGSIFTTAIGVGMGIGAGYASFIASMKNSDKRKKKTITRSIESDNTPDDIAWFDNLSPESIKMISEDGLTLSADFLRQPTDTHHTVILAHGYHHAHRQMIPYAKIFYQLGYNVLMPDARAHGESNGNVIGYGWLDRRDYVAWVQRAIMLTNPDEKIVLLGISMGAATVLAAASEPDMSQNLQAVIEDSSFSRLHDEYNYRLINYYHIPTLITPMVDFFTHLEGGYSMREVDITKRIANIEVPILFIHGDGDTYVPVEMVDELIEASRVPREIYIVEGADHVQSLATNPAQYATEIKKFVEKYVE